MRGEGVVKLAMLLAMNSSKPHERAIDGLKSREADRAVLYHLLDQITRRLTGRNTLSRPNNGMRLSGALEG
ncbi:hypothetical protein IF1G_07833 [Cordyceps javanica]|uniref:Uncharacterized protein n=1 Tax=Cordyceps javanica TaxID=43265 RepID=A0A545UUX4_9HYPO|nr:hypothetical protein IF1G_07833 [Cordyceps javanica]